MYNVLVVIIGFGYGNWVMTKINVMTFALIHRYRLPASSCSARLSSYPSHLLSSIFPTLLSSLVDVVIFIFDMKRRPPRRSDPSTVVAAGAAAATK